jgi:hypothetical protein
MTDESASLIVEEICTKSENSLQVKNPGPGFDFTQRGGVCRKLTNGIMEWWKNGILGMVSG